MRRGSFGAVPLSSVGLSSDGSGTKSASWTVNSDAVAGTNEDADLILKAGDGGTDLLDARLRLDGDNDRVILRVANNGTEIGTSLHIGTPGLTASLLQSIFLNAGNGAAARQCEIRADGGGGGYLRLLSPAAFDYVQGGTIRFEIDTNITFAPAGTRAVHVGRSASTTSTASDLVLNSGNGTTARASGLRASTGGVLHVIGEAGIQFLSGAHPGSTTLVEMNGSGQIAPQLSGSRTTAILVVGGNDVDTGFYRPAADIAGFTTGGVEEEWRNRTIQTTDATVTAIDTIALTDENQYLIETVLHGRDQAATTAAYYGGARRAIFERDGGGGATLLGSVQVIGTDLESAAGLDSTLAASGNNVEVRVTGLAGTTIRWHSYTTVRPINTV